MTATCPSASNTSKATLAYQNISKCLTTVPTDEGCGHFHRDCLGDEVMTPTVSRSSFISPLTLGWLEDLGYNVSYSEADPHSANQLGTHPTVECNCNRPILRTLRVASMSPRGVNSPNSDLHRKLSDEGRKMAMASGMKYLDEQAEEHAKSSVSTSGTSESEVFSPTEEAEFVGDQVVSVMYMEHGTIHTVLVRRHP